jgi:hypothetical protein
MKSGRLTYEIPLINFVVCKISGLRPGVGEVCTIVSCWAAYVGNCLPVFWDSLSVASSRIKQSKNMGLNCIVCFMCKHMKCVYI